VGELVPNGSASASTPLVVPADTQPGSYYIVGEANWNNAVAETSENNNDRSSGVFRVGGDLIVATMSAPSTAMANGQITVTESTKNQGAAAVPESVTAYYLSSNSTYSAGDQLIGSRTVGALGPSTTSTASPQLIIPAGTAPGMYYVIAIADANGVVAESLENNNVKSSAVMRVGPDLIVLPLTAPSSAVAGTSINVSDTTKNQGGDTAPASSTSFYLSTNQSIEAGDVFLGSRQVSSLGPGLSQAGSVMLPIPATTTAGTYYIIATADSGNVVVEVDETNNSRWKSISIAAAPPP
jgi:subtilase family serine protease